MKTTVIILSAIAVLAFSLKSYSQGYEMKEGETVFLDKNGNIINPECQSDISSKYASDITMENTVEKNSNYNNDGTLKLPGYVPSGIKEVDEQNYKKAKYKFYMEDPDGYKKWVEQNSQHEKTLRVLEDEFNLMPPEKQEQILDHPEKYRIVKRTDEDYYNK